MSNATTKRTGTRRTSDRLLAAAEALLAAKDSRMETSAEWRALRRAVQRARKDKSN